MLNGSAQLDAWNKFSAFEVFGDYAPMSGFRLLVKVALAPEALSGLLERRANESEVLDPVLAQCVLRAGVGLSQTGMVSFVYATVNETVCLVRPDSLQGAGAVMPVQSRLLAAYASRLSLLLGGEVAVTGQIFELPDMTIVRRAIAKLVEEIEDSTPLRSSLRLGAQMRGRGEPFHPSMLETLEEQSSLLQSNGVDMEALPPWWWRGIAACVRPDGGVELHDDLPSGDGIARLIPEVC